MATTGRKPTILPDADGERPSPEAPGTVQDLAVPDDLSETGRELWVQLVPYLAKHGVLEKSDIPMLTEMVEALSMARQYRRRFQEAAADGTITERDRNGNEYEVPFLDSKKAKRLRAGWKQTMDMAEKLATEFGLTPTARSRFGLLTASGQSLVEALKDARE